MKTKTINLYSYEELSDKAKERVLKFFREIEEHEFLSEDLEESLSERLEENNIKILNDFKLYYSLGYCQGDGACFIGLFNWKNYIISIKHNGHYYHKRSTNINIETEEGEEAPEEVYKEFEDLYFSLCDEIENLGYKIIEEEQSEEYIKENIETNEYTFRETGELENE